ncbi:MAG: hypothetical protein IKF38_02445 [Clostridia bacterium]|nr:hypothetical protein [Clostridia bacterium]
MINMSTIKEIYQNMIVKVPAPQETVEEAFARIRPYVETEILKRFQNVNTEELKRIVAQEEALGKQCLPIVEIDFSSPNIWIINLGVMAVSGKDDYTLHILTSAPFEVLLKFGNICRKFDKNSLDSLFPGEEKIPLTLHDTTKKVVLFIFKV